MKHTPGPWSVPHLCDDSIRCNCAYVLSSGYAGSICTIDFDNGKAISDGGNDSPPLDEAKANGLLIAAAPDLLAFAIEFKEAWDSGMAGDSYLLKMAERVIAKATTIKPA